MDMSGTLIKQVLNIVHELVFCICTTMQNSNSICTVTIVKMKFLCFSIKCWHICKNSVSFSIHVENNSRK